MPTTRSDGAMPGADSVMTAAVVAVVVVVVVVVVRFVLNA
jgi:hypothetical protein